MRSAIIWFVAGLLGLPLLLRAIELDEGFVVWVFGRTAVEMPVWFVLFALLAAIVAGWILISLIRQLWQAPRLMSQWMGKHRQPASQNITVRGFVALLEGDWTAAGRDFQKAADHAEDADSAAINLLLAAKARLEDDDLAGAEFMLKKAEQAMPRAHIAIGIYRIQFLQQAELFDEANRLIEKLFAEKPRNALLQKMLINSYMQRGESQKILDLLPTLQKQKLLPAGLLENAQRESCGRLLQQAPDAMALEACWDKFSAAARQDLGVIASYAQALLRTGCETDAETLLSKTLHKHWKSEFLLLYGQIQGADPLKQLQTAEHWLKRHSDDNDLLLLLARLCRRNQLWVKSRDYFHAYLQRVADDAVAQEMARLPVLSAS